MVLTVDIGNTNICLGLFDADALAMRARLATKRQETEDEFAAVLHHLFAMHGIPLSAVSGTIISSVVPEITIAVQNAVARLTQNKVLIVSPGVKTGLNILIDDPAQLGADLAAGAVGAAVHYPLPAFVIDLGTATKIYAVDAHKGFRGCVIAPGVAISLRALTDVSSLLPTIGLEAPKHACGTNSVESMQSGVILGTAAMLDGLLERFTEELGAPKTILGTGGLSACITPACKHTILQDGDLVLKGLKAIYDKNMQ